MRVGSDDPRGELSRPDFTVLVKLAGEGDQAAKEELVERLQRLVWYSIADFGLSREDRQDVFAGTFCRLFECLGSIRDPDRLPGWIATTARNEAHTLLRARGRVVITDELGESEDPEPSTDERLVERELHIAMQAAFRRLPDNCRVLLRLVTAVPRLSYEEISELLAMPHGSIGPTRQRCLDRLRSAAELQPFQPGGRP
jgi:RNA polymerase sigma factor (sigma-70 family)